MSIPFHIQPKTGARRGHAGRSTRGLSWRFVTLLLLALLLCGAWNSQARAATFNVTYTDGANEGFFDPSLGAARRAAFEASLSYWASHIGADAVPINVSASFDPLGGTADSATLGQAGPVSLFRDFSSSNSRFKAGTYYGSALANRLAGRDLDASQPDIKAQFNSDVDGPTVLGSRSFYYGTDANAGSDIDFYSVALHEIGHGLNFTALLDQSGNFGGTSNPYPGIYDTFLTQGSTATRTRLTAQSAAGRKAAEVSDNLYFDGPRTQSANGNAPAKLYAPTTYQGGSSVSHLDEATFSLPNINELLTPISSGPIHDAGPVALGVFYDMGWAAPPEVASINRLDPDPTSALTVRFAVTFSAPVSGVDASDFAVSSSGTISGASVSSVAGTGTTYTVSVSRSGGSGTERLDLVDNDSVVDSDGVPLGGTGTAPASGGDGSFRAGQLYTIAASGSVQSVVAVNVNNSNVVSINAESGAQNVIASANPPLTNSYCVARAADGTLYVANYSAPSIVKISPSGVPATLTTGTNLLNQPLDVVLGPDGALYVANYANNSIVRVDTATGAQTTVASGGSLSSPDGLAFGSDGKLYVGNAANTNVLKIDVSSGVQSVYASSNDLLVSGDQYYATPWGIAFGPDGSLYVNDTSNARLIKVPSGGGAASSVTAAGSFSGALGLAYGKDGNLYAANQANNSVVRVVPATGAQNVLAAGGALNSTTDVALAEVAPPTVSISGAPRVLEGDSGTTSATLTLNLSGPSTSDVSVSVATADGTATAGSDYVALPPTTYTIAAGSTSQTVTVQIKGDTLVEPDETFSVNLSNPIGATLGNAAATVTILNDDAPAPTSGVVISQFRASGPSGNLDEFIELSNTGNPALNLSGWKLTGGALSIALSGTIPQGGHLLATNSGGYSLSNYGGTGQGAGDVSYTGDLGTSGTLSLVNPQNISVDSVNLSALFGAASPASIAAQYAFVRRLDAGGPAKTGSDVSDFNLVDTQSTNSTADGSGIGPLTGARLGAPSPHNTLSPIARNARIGVAPLSIAGSGLTSEARYGSKGSGIDPQGRLSLRRTITNNTGGTVTRMRFRLIALTAGTSSAGASGAVADLRVISSAGVRYYDQSHVIQQAAEGITLDAPSSPTEVPLTSTSAGNGGGLNSTWSVPLPSGGLAAGQSLSVEWLFGIVRNGQYRVVLDTELLP